MGFFACGGNDLSLKQARERRDDLRAQIAQGIDPRIHRLQTKAAALAAPSNTFAAVFKSWRDFKALSLKSGRQSTLSQIDRIFPKDVLPCLGQMSIFDVDNPRLLDVLRRKAFTTAEKVRGWLNQLFRYAMVQPGVEHERGRRGERIVPVRVVVDGMGSHEKSPRYGPERPGASHLIAVAFVRQATIRFAT